MFCVLSIDIVHLYQWKCQGEIVVHFLNDGIRGVSVCVLQKLLAIVYDSRLLTFLLH